MVAAGCSEDAVVASRAVTCAATPRRRARRRDTRDGTRRGEVELWRLDSFISHFISHLHRTRPPSHAARPPLLLVYVYLVFVGAINTSSLGIKR